MLDRGVPRVPPWASIINPGGFLPPVITLPFDPWTGYGILVLSEIFIFVVLLLDLRLLKPLKLRFTIWVGPVISMYILGSIFYSIFAAIAALSTGALLDYGAFVVSALVGTLLGTALGRRIPVSLHADGSTWFQGGRGLVTLLWVLLLPRAIEQALILIPAIYQQGTVGSILDASSYLGYMDTLTGAMVIVGIFVSIGWRTEVQKKEILRAERPKSRAA